MSQDALEKLSRDVDALRSGLPGAENAWSPWIERVDVRYRASARNLAHYWSIRQHDLRDLQATLTARGLSSLGRSEPHVEATLGLVAAALAAMRGDPYVTPDDPVIGVQESTEVLQDRATELLGPVPAGRGVRIMVTLPSDAATDRDLVRDLVERGMTVARINCAKDDAQAWKAMADNVHEQARSVGRTCAIAMDLAGPKLRTGPLEPSDEGLRLGGGDMLRLIRDGTPQPADAEPPRIGCTLPQVFEYAQAGQRIAFDDGKLGGVIESVDDGGIDVRIEHPARDTAKLKAGKGINVPDTDLHVSALTDKDLEDLRTVIELADVVELSFVREPADVQRLIDELDTLGDDRLSIVLKIETQAGFEKLPQLVLTAMQRPRIGVMIARGDLAVEVGYERMAELQEEVLWLCESAHLPVIWATQVLEQLAKTGQPARAEVSDAAMSQRAECVMLNKGPYIADAVATLDSILRRMEAHLYKKNSLLRSLHSWQPEPISV